MKKKDPSSDDRQNILSLDEIRARKNTSLALTLKDTLKAVQAVSRRTCLVCQAKKACVNKAGVCSYCMEHVLTPDERRIAEEEAKHKIITIQVRDDRWSE